MTSRATSSPDAAPIDSETTASVGADRQVGPGQAGASATASGETPAASVPPASVAAGDAGEGDAKPRIGILRQGARYLVVGFSSAAIELGIFSLLFYVFHVDINIASPVSLVLSTIYNFFMSARWTFQGTSNIVRSAVLYLLLIAFNTWFSSWMPGVFASWGWPGIIAKMGTMACYTLWNFFLYRKFVFV
jgi:putative flippase GtrA